MKSMWLRLSALGLIGVASMLLAPLETLVPLDMPAMLVRALLLIQPALLVLAFAALGAWAAPKVGLDAPLVRGWRGTVPLGPIFRHQLPPAILVGLVTAAIIAAFGQATSSALAESGGVTDALSRLQIPLVTKLLYGGIVEELMLRWGLMSFFVWALWRMRGGGQEAPAWVYWVGIGASALLFAAGHLPALYALMPAPPSWLVLAVIAGNTLPGVLFGWLFWRRGLEAAMIAHALAHLFAVGGAALVSISTGG